MEVAEGEVAVLHCGPPLGHPEPNVRWKKDGLPIDYTDPHFTVSPAPSVPVEPSPKVLVCSVKAPGRRNQQASMPWGLVSVLCFKNYEATESGCTSGGNQTIQFDSFQD